MNIKIISGALLLTLASLACGFQLPQAPTPGPTVTSEVTVPGPDTQASPTHLKLSFGAGEMFLAPGAENNLVEGTAMYNYDPFKPIVETTGNNVTVKMGRLNTVPAFSSLENKWDLKLGNAPMDLAVEAGAYQATYELGGLALTNLTISDGAADVDLAFSKPNKSEMSVFKYGTGASNIKMEGLANANFSVFTFSGGAGDYTLDFSGDLQRDATATVDSGLCNLILIIPEGTRAVVKVDGGASNISASPSWEKDGDTYTQPGTGPTLTIVAKIGAGNLTLTH